MREFFTGAKPVSMAEASSKNGGGGGGQSTGGDRSGKILSAVGHQRKFRNFEKFGAILEQNRSPGGHAENGLVLKGKVSVINGRTTRTCTFKLNHASLALRVCKMEGGKRYVTYLDAKDFSWPKDVSGGPEIIKHSGGLAEAQLVESDFPLKGILVKPIALKDSTEDHVSWAVGESSRASPRKVPGSPVPAAVPASTMVVTGSPVTADAPASATAGSFLAFSGAVVTNQRMGDVTHTPIAGDSKADATHNSFSPLSVLGSGEDLCFGERDDFMVVSGEKGGDWSSPNAEPVVPSQVGGVEVLQDGHEHLLSQWKHSVVSPSGLFHGEDENGFLECSPLSKWDPNGHKELGVIQEGDEGEFRGSAEENSKWVCNLMKIFCRIVGFPIVKHEDQCLALFCLLEQDCVDVVSVGSSNGNVNSKRKGLRELKGLFSSINYDRVASKGRNRDLSVGTGVIASFK
nr:hypothetical protein CFP56_05481 [Quercus suber]